MTVRIRDSPTYVQPFPSLRFAFDESCDIEEAEEPLTSILPDEESLHVVSTDWADHSNYTLTV
jgi:hypothetical protein